MQQQVFGGDKSKRPQRPLYDAMRRGFFGKCPHCGEGKLFRSFLKTVDHCHACGEVMSHHRADDLPAYLVIFIVGHVVVGAFMGVEAMTNWGLWAHLAVWVPVTIVMSLALIGPIKGSVVGLQWAYYMHGFGGEDDGPSAHG